MPLTPDLKQIKELKILENQETPGLGGRVTEEEFMAQFEGLMISKEVKTAFGMGLAVIFVMTITAMLNWPIYNYVLETYNLSYLQFIVFILVIASSVQVVEIVIDRFFPAIYYSMGIFLPLITVNCAILGLSLFMILREYTFFESIVYAIGSGAGWMFVIVSMAGIGTRFIFSNVPEGLKGPGITMIITGIMALAFIGFVGVINI